MAELVDSLRPPLDSVPEGYKTINDWAQEMGKASTDMSQMLVTLLAQKKVVREKFRVRVGVDTTRRKWHYKVA